MHDKVKFITRWFTVGIVAALVGALAGVALRPDAARAATSDCPEARICIWDSINYSGYLGGWTAGYILTLPGNCLTLPASARGKASSIYVKTGLMSQSLTLWGTNGANRGIAGAQTPFMDSNMLAAPGLSSFSNVLREICVNE